MIKSNVLRIGNYVQDIVSGELMVVDELGETVGAVLVNRDKYPLPNGWQMGYVPLTPAILEKCSFEKIDSSVYRIKLMGQTFLEIIDSRMIAIVQLHGNKKLDEERLCLEDIKFLHQLQNLCFTLSGEELQINL